MVSQNFYIDFELIVNQIYLSITRKQIQIQKSIGSYSRKIFLLKSQVNKFDFLNKVSLKITTLLQLNYRRKYVTKITLI